jgi:DNA modification methylase
MHASYNLNRKWVGIDISPTAMKVNKKRLEELGDKVNIVDEDDMDLQDRVLAG